MKETIINYLTEHGKSSVNDIAHALNQAGGEKFPQLIKAISAMESKGQLRFNKDGSVSLRPKKEHPNQVTVEGVFRANKNGFGFLHVDDNEDDMFIGRNDVGHAIDGDTVAVVIKKPADRLRGTAAEARVVEIVERSLKTVVGKFILSDEKEPYAGYIKSKNHKIQQPIYIKKEPVALDGTEIIKVDIEKYPNRHYDYFVGSVRDIIGHQGDTGIDVLEVLESMDIISEFPEDVMAEAEAVPDAPSQEDLVGRVDLRQEVTFTIDGADAKDLDDAVHIKRLPNGNFELGVHIADVSYYVTEGSALNREAVARGTSVYVTDRVVSMLPERLSNGICSLNPNVDRLTQSAIMEITPKGKVVNHKICQSERGTAERMIESFMLAANECVAEHFAKAKLPFIYRIHEEPKAEKLQRFMDYASIFGVQIKGTANKMDQLDLQEFMARVQGKPGAEVMNMMLLRSMQQARYSEHNHGHYGLAAQYYTHFTSPIRRYPDLLVHRMIREYTNNLSQETREHFDEVIPELASSSSTLERRAIDAERVVEAMKKAEYMEEYVGQEFDGIVGSVVKFGMFVELPNTIEGLVHITTLPEFYNYNERTMTLQGEKTGKTFRVGQPIRVKLTRADKETGDVDFQYLPSEYDIIEKVDHKARQEREEKAKAFRHRGPRRDRQNGDFNRRGKGGDKRNHQDNNGRKGSYDDKRKSSKKPDKRKNQNRPHNDNKGRESGRRKKKGNKPFYKDVAKKRK